jgi:hypothetical protein
MGGARGKITEIRQEQALLSYYVEKWPANHRKNGIFVSTKMIIFEARRLVAHVITDFVGKTSWRYTHLLEMGQHDRHQSSTTSEFWS